MSPLPKFRSVKRVMPRPSRHWVGDAFHVYPGECGVWCEWWPILVAFDDFVFVNFSQLLFCVPDRNSSFSICG